MRLNQSVSPSNSRARSSDSGRQGSKTSQKTPKAGRTLRRSERQTREGEEVALKGSAGIQVPALNIPVTQQASPSGLSTPLIIVSSKPDLVFNNTPNNFIGGKAGFQFSTWTSITSDSWILNQIEGVYPEFNSPPHQKKVPTTNQIV